GTTPILVIGINALPFRYAAVSAGQTTEDLRSLLKEMCSECDWIHKGHNFGVQSAESARQVNAAIVLTTLIIYGVFAIACGGHITH
ncbi:hypothetical protein PENTCL1PPCAC_16267, partial [Pristionchus entomophagus]